MTVQSSPLSKASSGNRRIIILDGKQSPIASLVTRRGPQSTFRPGNTPNNAAMKFVGQSERSKQFQLLRVHNASDRLVGRS